MMGMKTRRRTLGLASVLALGCGLPDKSLGHIADTTGEGDTADASTAGDGVSGPSDATAGSETDDTSDVPVDCADPDQTPPSCAEDKDRDTVRRQCDNAPDHFNPSQSDVDEDELADVVDLCPTVASDNNSADSDKDGVGNDCDACGATLAQYNAHDDAVSVPDYMLVRNIPWQGDADQDGVGDVCDNCVTVANCADEEDTCQRDDDEDLVGDACVGMMGADAAGPVGHGAQDDFDQDGIVNALDACPRQPVPERIACTGPADCPEGSACEDDVCDHVDTDDDGVGDICDSCVAIANPLQTMDGAAQEEDEDGDFVADVCETNAACSVISDPPPMGFYEVSVSGACCTVGLVEDDDGNLVRATTGAPLVDPDGLPIRLDCTAAGEEAGTCRRLPASVASAPGVLTLPAGCEDALALAGIAVGENQPLGPDDFAGSLDALWAARCSLPQWDQDFDGLGDACDWCPFAFDPDNIVYVDDEGETWPGYGKYCFGDYDPEVVCGL